MKIADYFKWKQIFDQFSNARKSIGSAGGKILKNPDNNTILVMIKWMDIDKAKQFHESDMLQKAMKSAGMIGRADVQFYYEEEYVEF